MKVSLSNPKVILGLAILVIGCLLLVGHALAASPSFDCRNVRADSIEDLICQDEGLAALDRRLAEAYVSAASKALNQHPPRLKGEQRGWIKGRNDCWKSADRHKCVEEIYRLRIAELQARYHLISETGTVRYECDGEPAYEVIATFFPTDPPSLVAERGDRVSMMFRSRVVAAPSTKDGMKPCGSIMAKP